MNESSRLALYEQRIEQLESRLVAWKDPSQVGREYRNLAPTVIKKIEQDISKYRKFICQIKRTSSKSYIGEPE